MTRKGMSKPTSQLGALFENGLAAAIKKQNSQTRKHPEQLQYDSHMRFEQQLNALLT